MQAEMQKADEGDEDLAKDTLKRIANLQYNYYTIVWATIDKNLIINFQCLCQFILFMT